MKLALFLALCSLFLVAISARSITSADADLDMMAVSYTNLASRLDMEAESKVDPSMLLQDIDAFIAADPSIKKALAATRDASVEDVFVDLGLGSQQESIVRDIQLSPSVHLKISKIGDVIRVHAANSDFEGRETTYCKYATARNGFTNWGQCAGDAYSSEFDESPFSFSFLDKGASHQVLLSEDDEASLDNTKAITNEITDDISYDQYWEEKDQEEKEEQRQKEMQNRAALLQEKQREEEEEQSEQERLEEIHKKASLKIPSKDALLDIFDEEEEPMVESVVDQLKADAVTHVGDKAPVNVVQAFENVNGKGAAVASFVESSAEEKAEEDLLLL